MCEDKEEGGRLQEALSQAEECYFVQGNKEAAAVFADEALELNPDSARALSIRGHCYLDNKQLDQAKASYEKALKLEENAAEAYRGLGILEEEKGNHAKAEAHLRKALSYAPESFYAQYSLGCYLSRRERFKEAEACLKNSVLPKQLSPVISAEYRFHLGKIAEYNEQYEEAIVHYQYAYETEQKGEYYLCFRKLFHTLRVQPIPKKDNQKKDVFLGDAKILQALNALQTQKAALIGLAEKKKADEKHKSKTNVVSSACLIAGTLICGAGVVTLLSVVGTLAGICILVAGGALLLTGGAVKLVDKGGQRLRHKWLHKKIVGIDQKLMKQAEGLTAPQILANAVNFHQACTEEMKSLTFQTLFDLYEIGKNRPIMDMVALMTLRGTPPLRIHIAPKDCKQELKIQQRSGGHYGCRQNLIDVAMYSHQLDCFLIHEMTHAAITGALENEAKSYQKGAFTSCTKKDYMQAIAEDKQYEHEALTYREQYALRHYLAPYWDTIYQSYNAIKYELDPVTAEMITLCQGDVTVLENRFPQLWAHYQQIVKKIEHCVQQHHWQPAAVPLSDTKVTAMDFIDNFTVARAIILRAQKAVTGDVNHNADKKGEGEEMLFSLLTKIMTEQGIQFEEMYKAAPQRSRILIGRWCDACAKVMASAFTDTKPAHIDLSLVNKEELAHTMKQASESLVALQSTLKIKVVPVKRKTSWRKELHTAKSGVLLSMV